MKTKSSSKNLAIVIVWLLSITIKVNSMIDLKGCLDNCTRTEIEDLWHGRFLCTDQPLPDDDPNFPEGTPEFNIYSKCDINCRGYKVAADQDACLCHNCKTVANNDYEYLNPFLGISPKGFCSQPGAYIADSIQECDKVCKGERTFMGKICTLENADLAKINPEYGHSKAKERLTIKKCNNLCRDASGEDAWTGEIEASDFPWCGYYDGDASAFLTDCFVKCARYHVEYESALAWKRDPSCECNFCKAHPLNHLSFCTEPGVQAHIRKDECGSHVCNGTARFHGAHCNPKSAEEFEETKKTFGDPVRQQIFKCNTLCRNASGEDAWLGNGNGIAWTRWCAFYKDASGTRIAVYFTKCFLDCMDEKPELMQDITFEDAPLETCGYEYCTAHPLNYIYFCRSPPGRDGSIGFFECDRVRKGEAYYHGAYCRYSGKEVSVAKKIYNSKERRVVERCNRLCRSAIGEEVWRRQNNFTEPAWCSYFVDGGGFPISVFYTPCFENCLHKAPYWIQHRIFLSNASRDNLTCECDFCKADYINYHSFCSKPGWRAHIKGHHECDSRVCTGRARFFGGYCNPNSKEEFLEAQKEFGEDPIEKMHKCWEKCGGDNSHFKDMFKGELSCAFESSETCAAEAKSQSSWNTKCYWDCMDVEIAEDQNECACQHCKGTPLAHAYFCNEPGLKTFVDKDCDKHVCNGTVKYHGKFCSIKTKAEYDQARVEYGVINELLEKCSSKCGGDIEFHKQLYRGEHVCVLEPEGYPSEYLHGTYYSQCIADCTGFKISDNETACACSVCKYKYGPPDISVSRGFCTERGKVEVMTEEDCAEKVCSALVESKPKYYGIYCNATQEVLEEAEKKFGETFEERIARCKDACDEKTLQKELLTGGQVCVEAKFEDGSFGPQMLQKCFLKCMGLKPAKDQNKCACNYCKSNTTSVFNQFQNFCLKQGPEQSIKRGDCDRLVCTGEAKFHGQYCNTSVEELAAARKEYGVTKREKPTQNCYQLCELIEDWDREVWNGQFVCGYEDADYTKPFMNTRCYFDCRGLEVAENQPRCRCDFCKDGPDNHDDFCVKPGWRAKISSDQCDELVCSGQAKYYRHYCNPASRSEIRNAQQQYGDSNDEPTKSCWKDCDERKWYNEMIKGEHVCGYMKSGAINYPIMEQKCVVDCLGIQPAKSQRKCSFQYCYDSPRNSLGFCLNPGVNASITKDDCFRMVQRGNVKYHGVFCDLHTIEELEEAIRDYGDQLP